jgi:ferrous iron transport protein A
MIPLTNLKSGERCTISSICCGKDLMKRLCDMGIVQGKTIKVSRNNSGPLIIEVLDSRIAIGRGQANKIMVDRI